MNNEIDDKIKIYLSTVDKKKQFSTELMIDLDLFAILNYFDKEFEQRKNEVRGNFNKQTGYFYHLVKIGMIKRAPNFCKCNGGRYVVNEGI